MQEISKSQTEVIEGAAGAYIRLHEARKALRVAEAILGSHEAQMVNRSVPSKLRETLRTVQVGDTFVTLGYVVGEGFNYSISAPLVSE